MRIAILSPHRDDAAFSCGLTMHATLQAGVNVTVMNVFTQSDYAVDLRTIDPALSLVDGVSQARLLEDQQFVADIARSAGREPHSVRLQDLNLLDAPLRLTVRTEQVLESPLTDAGVQQQAVELAAHLPPSQDFDLVFAPLALGDHIDHRIVREAAKSFAASDRLCFYEDLPYAARLASRQRKEQALRAIASNRLTDFVQYALRLPGGPHLKRRFAMHYPSQIAVEVAGEVAAYAAQWAGGDAGAERWWATRAAGGVVAGLLQGTPASCSLVEEQR